MVQHTTIVWYVGVGESWKSLPRDYGSVINVVLGGEVDKDSEQRAITTLREKTRK